MNSPDSVKTGISNIAYMMFCLCLFLLFTKLLTGFEPVASALPRRRSTSWAIAAIIANIIYYFVLYFKYFLDFIFIYLKSLQKTRQNHDILQRLLYFVWNSLFLSKLMKTISRIAPLLRNFRNPANTSYHCITEEVKVHPG